MLPTVIQDWLTASLTLAPVLTAAVWGGTTIKALLDQSPVIWAMVQRHAYGDATLTLSVRNRAPSDLLITAATILNRDITVIDDRGEYVSRCLLNIHVPPCPPFAADIPEGKTTLRIREAPGTPIRLRVELQRSRRWFSRYNRTINAVDLEIHQRTK